METDDSARQTLRQLFVRSRIRSIHFYKRLNVFCLLRTRRSLISQDLRYRKFIKLRELIFSRFTPCLQSAIEILKGIGCLCRLCRQLLPLAQEVTAMLNDVMDCEIHQSKIGLLIGVHKVSAQMIDGREAIVVIGLREVLGKDRIALNGPRLVKSHEKARIDLAHRRLEQLLQQVEAPTTAHVTATLPTMNARLGRRLRAIEQTTAPRRLFLKMQKLALGIGHRPTNGAGSHVEADIVVARVVS